MNKAQEMLAKAGFPDTKQGRAAFHKMYPTPEDFFKVHGDIFKNAPKYIPITLPITPENVILDHSPDRDYYLENTLADSPETDDDTNMYKAGGGIHIKPSKRGTFTAAASKHGKSVQAFASQVLANKGNYSPAMVKKANFARNAAKWKHEDGGPVMYADGGKLPEGILRSRLEAHMSPNEAQSYIDSYALGSVIGGNEGPDFRGSGTQYDRFPKSNPGFNNNPGTFWNYMDRLGNRNVHYATPHKGVKDAPVNMHTITGSCESGTCYEFHKDGGVVDAYQLMGMPTPRMFGPGGPTNPNDMSLFTMTYGNPNRYFETKQEGDKYFVQQRGDFPLSNQQFKNWKSPSATFASPNQLNEWHSIGANEYNRLNSQAVNGRIGYQTYAYGGHINHYIPSYNFGHVQSANNTYRHGYGYGGPIGKYDFGSTIKTIGAAAYGAGEGLLDTVTMGATDQLTDAGYNALQKAGGSSEAEKHKQNAWHGGFQTAGAVTGAVLNPASTWSAVQQGTKGVGEVIGETNPNSKKAQDWRQGLTMAGGIAGMAGGMGAFGAPGASAAGLAKTQNFQSTGLGNFAGNAAKAGQGFNAISSGNPMAMLGAFGGMGGMGGGSNMGTTGTSNFSPDPNQYMNQGINFNYSSPSFHAMGGAVNAPEMMKYAQGGGVDMTEINVEHNELLTDENGNILTEYGSNALPPHPADGSAHPNGTVPAPPGAFVITKALSEKYKAAMKNNDKLHADAMRNNITFDKQRKEAKQQAQQAMAQQTMMAKFGGMVGQYGYGGGVMKYDGGSGVNFSNPYGLWNNSMSAGIQPGMQTVQNANQGLPGFDLQNFLNLNGLEGADLNPESVRFMMNNQNKMNNQNNMSLMERKPAQLLPVNEYNEEPKRSERFPLLPPKLFPGDPGYGEPDTPYREVIPTGGNANDGFDAGNVTTAEQIARMDAADSPQEWNDYARAQNNPNKFDYTSTSALGYNDPSNKNGFNYNKMLDFLPMGISAGLGLEALLQKPFNMNAEDYMIKSKLNPYEEQYRPDYRAYNAALYSSKNNPNLAARTELFNRAQQAFADEKYKVNQANLARKMQADQYNIGLEGQNLSTRMNIAQFNEQNRAARRNAIREQFGKNLPADIYNYQTNQMSKEALSARYKDHKFSWDQNYG